MATVFDKILDTTTGPKAYDWYRRQVRGIVSPGARSLINAGKATMRPKYGVMNLFGYDAKHKATLPYYDRFPLIFPVEPAKGGFYGVNFHYLPYGTRVAFLRRLSEFASDKRYDKKTRYKFNYNALRSNPYMKKTTKHYLWNHVRTTFLNITADEMPIAIFLPIARFVGATEQAVWRRA